MTNKQEKNTKIKLPIFSYVFFGIAALSLIIYIIAINNTGFADYFNRHISSFFRLVLAKISGIIPLSFAELFVICSPIILFIIIRFAMKRYIETWRHVGIFCVIVLSIGALFFSIFVLNFGIAYHTTSIDKRLELDKKDVSANELANTAEWLIDEVNSLIDEVEFEDKSSSIMPYSLKEMNNELISAYQSLSERYTFIPYFKSRIKPIMLSEPMTYTHISGVYTFFTGEANLNTNGLDYSLVFTTAHELAHQRGIAREDEANFVAFLVCAESDEPYIKYCAYMNLCEYVLNALYSADSALWETTYKKLDNRAIYEMIAYNDHYEKYRDNVVGEISGAINDAYLQANGTQGSVSYGLVVDLAVAYFHKNIEN